jgi:hypothetical protein
MATTVVDFHWVLRAAQLGILRNDGGYNGAFHEAQSTSLVAIHMLLPESDELYQVGSQGLREPKQGAIETCKSFIGEKSLGERLSNRLGEAPSLETVVNTSLRGVGLSASSFCNATHSSL